MDTEQTRHTTASLDPDLPIERSAFVVVDRDGTAPHRFIQYGAGSDPYAIVCAVVGCPTDDQELPLPAQLRHPIHSAASYTAGLIPLADVEALPAAEAWGAAQAAAYSEGVERVLRQDVVDAAVDTVAAHDAIEGVDEITGARHAIIRQNALDAVEAAKIRSDTTRDLAAVVQRAVDRVVGVADEFGTRRETAVAIQAVVRHVLAVEADRVTDAEEDARRYVAALDERRDGVDRSEIPF